MYKLCFLFLFLSSCSSIVDAPYREYAERFEKEYKAVEVSIIEDGFMSDMVYGSCYKNTHTYIHINKNNWKDLTDTQKEILIFHELGHCVLDKEDGQGIMMDCAVENLTDYEENRDEYIKELLGD